MMSQSEGASTSGLPDLLAIEDVSVEFWNGARWEKVVDSIFLRVNRGEAVGLVGESGCGKTTTAYSALGYRQPGSRVCGGRVLFEGQDLLTLPAGELRHLRGRDIGHVPQDPTSALNPSMRVGRQVREALRNHDWPGDLGARVVSLLALVGLEEPEVLARRFPCQLSGGQQQRVMIAMAVACEPKLVVLDEPTTGLDVTSQALVLKLLRELRAERSVSLLYITHDLGVVADICDRVVVMYGGRVVEEGPMKAVFDHPRHPYTSALIGSLPQSSATEDNRGLKGSFERDKLPPGCPFTPRCPLAEERCAQEVQQLRAVGPGHSAACWRWELVPDKVHAAEGLEDATGDGLPAEPRLEVRSLTCGYGPAGRRRLRLGRLSQPVVRDVSFAIRSGETVALVGESGSGKSTIARAIAGLLVPLGGQVTFEGRTLAATVERRGRADLRRVQIVFQNPDASLNPRQTVGRIMGRALNHYFSLSAMEVRARTKRLLEDVQLDPRLTGRYPRELSGGERQRVAIARALAAEPSVLICDEILSALDVSVQASIVALLRDLQREHAFSILFISHDLAVVRSLANRVVVLYGGQVCEVGVTQRLFTNPLHPYTRALLASVPGQTMARDEELLTKVAVARHVESSGCVFARNCPFYLGPVCETEVPPKRIVGEHDWVRCHIDLPVTQQGRRDGEGPDLEAVHTTR